MKKIILFLFLNLQIIQSYSQQEFIMQFKFTMGGMGGLDESVILRKDSCFIKKSIVEANVKKGEKDIKTLTSKSEWEKLLGAISNYELSNLINLPSPTSARDFDGAEISEIVITTNTKEYYCGDFDGYNPNQRLEELLKNIIEIKNSRL